MNFENSKKAISIIIVFAVVFLLTSAILFTSLSNNVQALNFSDGKSKVEGSSGGGAWVGGGSGGGGAWTGGETGGTTTKPAIKDPNPGTGPQDMVPATLIFSAISALSATGIYIKKRK